MSSVVHSTLRIQPFRRLLRWLLAVLIFAGGFPLATAQEQKPDQDYPSYADHPQAKAFIDEIVAEKILPRKQVAALMANARQQPDILEAIARPAEKTFTWGRYRKIFLTEDRITQGLSFYRQHKTTLQRAEQQFGVPIPIILAIIGVETRYGVHKGRYRVLDALTTLAFDYPPRAKFFRSELKQFLQLAQEANIDLMAAKGSYAGAMGFGQFISSSYRHYGVDFDQDQQIDLINNPVDAIGSVANYFKQHHWQPGAPVASIARLMGSADERRLDLLVNLDLKPVHSIGDFIAAGLVPDQAPSADHLATGWRLEGENGIEYWLGFHNFYVITRYNHSHLYALAVYQLSEQIRQRILALENTQS